MLAWQPYLESYRIEAQRRDAFLLRIRFATLCSYHDLVRGQRVQGMQVTCEFAALQELSKTTENAHMPLNMVYAFSETFNFFEFIASRPG